MPPIYENGIWQGEVVPIPDEWPHFRKILLERLRKFPNRVSQIDAVTDHNVTYAQMADRIIKCSLWLKKQNLKSDDIIGICSYRHIDTIVPLVASILVGVTVHPWWNATLTDDTIKHFLHLTKPKIIFADETKVNEIKRAVDETGVDVKIIAFNDAPQFETLSSILESHTPEEVANFQCESLHDVDQQALILCTSGTTGYPKGVLLSYGWLIKLLVPVDEIATVNYWPAGIDWGTGTANTLQTIFKCSTSVIHPSPDEETILKIIEKYKIIGILGLNTAYAIRMCSSDIVKNYDVSSIKFMLTGGSAMYADADEYMVKSFKNAKIMNGYGCTEAAWLCCRLGWTGKPTSCGTVVKNMQLKVVDVNNGKTLGYNEEGEICAKFQHLMLRYYNNPEATQAVFDDDGWYHTGDIGYFDEDGEFFIVDRLKDLIKFRMNYHFPPSMVEKVIAKCPGVYEVAVVAKPHVEDIEQPMAFVSILPGAKTTEQDIIDFVAQNLPDYMHLRGGVVILQQLPHTENGKVSKGELKQQMKSYAAA